MLDVQKPSFSSSCSFNEGSRSATNIHLSWSKEIFFSTGSLIQDSIEDAHVQTPKTTHKKQKQVVPTKKPKRKVRKPRKGQSLSVTSSGRTISIADLFQPVPVAVIYDNDESSTVSDISGATLNLEAYREIRAIPHHYTIQVMDEDYQPGDPLIFRFFQSASNSCLVLENEEILDQILNKTEGEGFSVSFYIQFFSDGWGELMKARDAFNFFQSLIKDHPVSRKPAELSDSQRLEEIDDVLGECTGRPARIYHAVKKVMLWIHSKSSSQQICDDTGSI